MFSLLCNGWNLGTVAHVAAEEAGSTVPLLSMLLPNIQSLVNEEAAISLSHVEQFIICNNDVEPLGMANDCILKASPS